jgi:hypothetical protein
VACKKQNDVAKYSHANGDSEPERIADPRFTINGGDLQLGDIENGPTEDDNEEDDNEEVAPLSVSHTHSHSHASAGFDAAWYQTEWQRLTRVHLVNARTIEHAYLDADSLERLVERNRFTLVASGSPEPGVLKVYFFAEQSEAAPSSNGKKSSKSSNGAGTAAGGNFAMVLVELVINTTSHDLVATIKSDSPTAAKAFGQTFLQAFQSILVRDNSNEALY